MHQLFQHHKSILLGIWIGGVGVFIFAAIQLTNDSVDIISEITEVLTAVGLSSFFVLLLLTIISVWFSKVKKC
ncbi:MAG: hypothetical protein AAB431_04135 [Patescibacteria group bacterium]